MRQDKDYWLSLKEKRREQYSKTHAAMREWETAYLLKHYDEQDDVERGARIYRHTDTVDFDYVQQLAAMVTVPDVTRTFWTDNQDSKKAQDACDRAEKYVSAVWRMNRSRRSVDIRRQVCLCQDVYGVAYPYVWVDPVRLKLYKSKRTGVPPDSFFPIVIDLLNPFAVLPNPQPGQWDWTDDVMRVEDLPAPQVAQMWGRDKVKGLLKNPDDADESSGPTSTFEYIDIWQYLTGDDGPELWHGVIYADEWLKEPQRMDKWYPMLPVIQIPGVDTPVQDLDKRFVSVLYALMKNRRTQEGIISRIMTVATYQADPTILARVDDNLVIEKGPGKVIPLKEGEIVSYLQGIGASPQLLQVFQVLQSDVQRSSLPMVHYGQAPAGWSGYMANQAISGGSLKNEPVVKNLQDGITKIDNLILSLTRTFFPADKQMSARGYLYGRQYTVQLKPVELNDIQCMTQLSPKTPADEQAKMGIAQMLRAPGPGQLPLVSDNYVRREVLGIEDASSAERDVMREAIQQIPTLRKYAAVAALRTADWPDEIVAAAEQELNQMLGVQQGGQTGAPGQPMQGQPAPQPGQEGGAVPQSPEAASPQTNAAGEQEQQLAAMIQQAMGNGQLPQQIAQQALQMLQQGQPAAQVVQWIKQAMAQMQQQPGQAAPPPEAAPPQPGLPPEQPAMEGQGEEVAQLRYMINEAMQSGRLPPDAGQQALTLLDQGQPVEVVVQYLNQVVQGTKLQQAQAMLEQQGLPDAALELEQMVAQGMPVEQALQQVMARRAQQGMMAGGENAGQPV